MKRVSLRNSLSSEQQDLSQVWEWYQFQLALLNEESARVSAALSIGGAEPDTRYFGLARDELDAIFSFQRTELDRLTMLGMLAAIEAALRVDFIVRIANRMKDSVSRRFREIDKRLGSDRVRLEEDILDVWRQFGATARVRRAVSQFRAALRLRHWLAHGRYWKPKLGRDYDPIDVWDVGAELLAAIG